MRTISLGELGSDVRSTALGKSGRQTELPYLEKKKTKKKINDTNASGFYEYGIVHKELNNINKATYLPQQFASISINIQSKQFSLEILSSLHSSKSP